MEFNTAIMEATTTLQIKIIFKIHLILTMFLMAVEFMSIKLNAQVLLDIIYHLKVEILGAFQFQEHQQQHRMLEVILNLFSSLHHKKEQILNLVQQDLIKTKIKTLLQMQLKNLFLKNQIWLEEDLCIIIWLITIYLTHIPLLKLQVNNNK